MKRIDIIHIEDDQWDADLVTRELEEAGILFNQVVVSSKEQFINSLNNTTPSIILSDHSLQAFNSMEALEIVKEKNLNIPFILITGNTSEEFAVSVMKAGADDYILKDRIKRLPSAIINALHKFELSEERIKLQQEKQERDELATEKINKIAQRLKLAAKSAGIGIWDWDITSNHLSWDEGMYQLYKIEPFNFESLYNGWITRVHPDDRKRVNQDIESAISGIKEYDTEYRIVCGADDIRYIRATGIIERDEEGTAINMVGVNWDISRQKESENTINSTAEALQNALNELNKIMDSSLDVICTINGAREFVNVSSASERVFGFTPGELQGRKYIELVYPEDVEITIASAIEIMSGHPVSVFENRYVRKNKTTVPIMWSATWDDTDRLMYCIAKDVTDRKMAEQQLVIQEKRYRALVENGADGLAILSAEGHLNYISPTIERILGYSEAEILQMNLFSLVHPDNMASVRKVWDDVLSRPGLAVEGHAIQIKHKDGTWRWHEATLTNMLHDTSINGIVDNFRDITEKIEAEKLRKFEQINKEALINTTEDRIWSVGNDFKLIAANKAFITSLHERFELIINPADELLAKEYFQPDYIHFWKELYTRALHGESFVKDIFLPVAEKDPVGWGEIKFNPIYDGDKIAGVACYSRDITERKISEIKLNELNENLEKHLKKLAISNAELEQFAYVASHDLQEPLRMITSFLVQLEKKYENIIDDKGKKYIAFAVDGAKRMRQIILDLLEFSRVGRSDDNRETLDLNELINEILILLSKKIEDKNATIIVDKLPVIYAYRSPLHQVFQNLIGNGLKYSKKNMPAQIRVAVTDLDTHWKFAIIDNGIGIDKEYFDKIFIIFQRLHNKDEYSGTGMGLAITKKIIENLGGEIWVESEEGNGSTFYFTLLKDHKHDNI